MIGRDDRQATCVDWVIRAFGRIEAIDLRQRGVRLLEEAVEAAQAAGVPEDMAHRLVTFMFAKPAGDLRQEIGGVGVCLLALASAAGTSADQEEARELARVLSIPVDHFRQRNAAKNAAGFLATGAKAVDDPC